MLLFSCAFLQASEKPSFHSSDPSENQIYQPSREIQGKMGGFLESDDYDSIHFILQERYLLKIIEEYSKKHVLRGTILIAQGEKILYANGCGFADKEAHIDTFNQKMNINYA